MKNAALLVATAAASVTAVRVAEIPHKQVSTESQPPTTDPGFLSFPIYHRPVSKPILKRNTDVTIYNISSVSYLVQCMLPVPCHYFFSFFLYMSKYLPKITWGQNQN